jgi:hypothetical protein
MPNIDNFFPSKYLKCSDLQGHEVKVVVERIEVDSIGDDRRAVLYFRGKQKGLVLNKTNANTIKDMWGNDTDGWAGKEITIYPTRVDFKGDRVDAIRIQFVQPGLKVRQAASPELERAIAAERGHQQPPADPARADMNDEIPF